MSFNGYLYATGEGYDLGNKGDIHTHDASSQAALAVGSNSYILSADTTAATGLAWVANTDAGLTLGTKGDIHTRNATDNVAIAVSGNDGYVLSEDSTEATGLKWVAVAGGASASDNITLSGKTLTLGEWLRY